MKNYKLFLILTLAVFLRLNYDVFINGYNFDELAIMSSAVQSFPFDILKTCAKNDYHAPLYQLIVHFFTYFNPEWLYIRLFNVVLSVLNVYVFYKLGKLIKDRNTGYFCASVLAINHLAISTATFVKFYALAFLLCSINIYYFAKILKFNNGYIKFAITNIFLILTSTYSFIFVFLEFLFLFLNKKSKIAYKSALISFIGLILYSPILLYQLKLNFTNIFSPHSYYVEFAPISFYNILNDFFAPLLNYCCNLPTISSFTIFLNFIKSFISGNIQMHYLVEFIVFSILPVLIAIYFIILSTIENNVIKKINIISLSFLLIFIILTKLEITGAVPIYIYPCALIFLVSFGVGVDFSKNKKLHISLFAIYVFTNLFITNCYPPQKRGFFRPKIYHAIEQYYKDNESVKLIATSGARFLKAYYKDKTIFDFDNEKMKGMFGREFISLVYGRGIGLKINKDNAFELLSPLILKKYRCPDFENYFVENLYNKLKNNEQVVFAFTGEEYNFIDKYENYTIWLKNKPYRPHLSKADFKNALSDYENYLDSAVFTQIIESYGYEYLINLLDKYFKRIKFEQYTKTDSDEWIKSFEDYSNTYSTLYLAQNANKSWIFVTYKKQ